MAKNDIYGEPSIIKTPKAIITVYSPILDADEYERRMKIIKDAAASVLVSMERNARGI